MFVMMVMLLLLLSTADPYGLSERYAFYLLFTLWHWGEGSDQDHSFYERRAAIISSKYWINVTITNSSVVWITITWCLYNVLKCMLTLLLAKVLRNNIWEKKTDCEKIFHCLYYYLHGTSRKMLTVLLLTY